jgi:ATP-dependent RNA helicase DeaD
LTIEIVPTIESPNFFSTLPMGIQKHLEKLGISEPTAIQTLTIEPARAGQDLLAQSHTGSGKTLAFGLGLALRLQELKKAVSTETKPQTEVSNSPFPKSRPKPGGVLGLVMTPTRELAAQVAKVLEPLLALQGGRVLAITGGESYVFQKKSLQQGVDVVVGTPGRVSDLARQGALDLKTVKLYVLDEVDQMLDIGFAETLKEIRAQIDDKAQSFFFSATLSKPIRELAKKLLNNPVEIQAAASSGPSAAPIEHRYIEVMGGGEWKALIHCLLDQDPEQALIFCRTRAECAEVTEGLQKRNISAAALHGDLSQDERNKTMNRFRTKSVRFLVATNVAARGLDVQGLPLVVNFNCPEDAESYTHRSGRTGRAGATGMAWTIVTPRHARLFESILRQTKIKPEKWEIPHAGVILKKHVAAVVESITVSTKTEVDERFDKVLSKALDNLTDEEKNKTLRTLLSRQLKKLETYDLESIIPTRPVVRLDGGAPDRNFKFEAPRSDGPRKRSFFGAPSRSSGPRNDFAAPKPPFKARDRDPKRPTSAPFAKPKGKVVPSIKSTGPRTHP